MLIWNMRFVSKSQKDTELRETETDKSAPKNNRKAYESLVDTVKVNSKYLTEYQV